jgi:Flp pilus assembly pilin Flp
VGCDTSFLTSIQLAAGVWEAQEGRPIMAWFIRFCCDEEATTSVEYAVMLALIISVIISAISAVGGQTGGMWGGIQGNMDASGIGGS